MTELLAKVKLRPTRIGFLVRPSDRKSVREIMRINACLWGGQYNPIIPVFKDTPDEWKDKYVTNLEGRQVAEGYIKFFEPDVYVEAEIGLLEEVGLGEQREDRIHPSATSLDQFFTQEYRGVYEPFFGQSVLDIINESYLSERRFQLRDENLALYADSTNRIFAELCIGVYQENDKTQIIHDYYTEVFQPESVPSLPNTWLRLFFDGCVTPFSVTSKHFDIRRSWSDDPIIYVFDPSKTTDLIDLWNLRIQPSRVYPVPIGWLPELSNSLHSLIKHTFRPLKGNPNGVMHKTTLEISRSITENFAKTNILPFFYEVTKGSLITKYWHTPIWQVDYSNQFVSPPERAMLTSDEKDQSLLVKEDSYFHTEFETLSPSFSEHYSGSNKRWANVLSFTSTYQENSAALCMPYNTFEKDWPFKGLKEFIIGREGWTFLQNFKGTRELVNLLKQDEAIFNWLQHQGITAALSEAGLIAKQVINSLGGFWGLYLFDDTDSLIFINNLANSARIRTSDDKDNIRIEEFSGRSATIKQWQDMIAKRKAKGAHHRANLSSYIEKNVIKIGLETECHHCRAKNWHDLDEVSYRIKCIRCLKLYDFPQAEIKQHNQNWKYRVIGPFAVPDYAQGAYAALLTIRFFTKFRSSRSFDTYSTALEFEHEGKTFEVDFAIWSSEESGLDVYGEPRLIIGEAKSFAIDAVKESDLEQLKTSGSLIPGSFLVVSVLKESFSDDEIARLKKFVEWTRESKSYGPKHWLILLTATELFDDHLERNWKEKGKPYSDFANYHNTKSLESLSDSTLSIYLGEKSYYEWSEENKN